MVNTVEYRAPGYRIPMRMALDMDDDTYDVSNDPVCQFVPYPLWP